jgi:hypothetical protein
MHSRMFQSTESLSSNATSRTQLKTENINRNKHYRNQDDEYDEESENEEIHFKNVTDDDDEDIEDASSINNCPYDENEDNNHFKKVHMPAELGRGKVVKWYASVGDVIKYNDVFVDIETVDFVMGINHDDYESMIMHRISAPTLQNVAPGDILCILRREGTEEQVESYSTPQT